MSLDSTRTNGTLIPLAWMRVPLVREVDEAAAVLAGAAVVLAGAPAVRVRLAADHREGDDGRCAGCVSAVRLAPRWPCRLATLARMAEELAQESVPESAR